MAPEKSESLPKNAIEAQGLLIKAIYEKFGEKAIPIIADVLKRQGRALGHKVKEKLPDNRLSTVAKNFTKNWDPALVKVISVSDEKFHIQGIKCPFGLEDTSRELCKAVMEIDREYFFVATDGRTELEILQTVAAGDPQCDTIYTIKKSEK